MNYRRLIFSEVEVLDSEDPEAFDRLHHSLVRTFNPADTLEHELVEAAALIQWRLDRVHRLENTTVDLWRLGESQPCQLAHLSRYEMRLNRNLHNTLAMLHAAKGQGRSEEESQ